MATEKDLREARIALTRFGLGAKPGEVAEWARGPREALGLQLDPANAVLPGQFPTTSEGLAIAFDFKAETKAAKRLAVKLDMTKDAMRDVVARGKAAVDGAAADDGMADDDATMDKFAPDVADKDMDAKAARRSGPNGAANPIREVLFAEIAARFRHQTNTSDGYVERLVGYWANHFCISAKKRGYMKAIAGAYEREAIRPHVLGRFSDMLIAATRHPAMLIYLDNIRSVGPNTRLAKRRGTGLNENLAREVMELHTMGAGSGYTQADVTEFAKALTGWSVAMRQDDPPYGVFVYHADRHEPGAVTILGKRYDAADEAQAIDALRDFARHPKTALNVSRRLARHFVAEDPPESLVRRLARVFLDTDGDLKQVALTLAGAPEAWAAPQRRVLPPWDMLVAAGRAFDVEYRPGEVVQALNTFGQGAWEVPSPKGWPDEDEEWAAPDALLERLDWAVRFGQQRQGRVDDVAERAADLIGPGLSEVTLQAIRRAEDRSQAIALLLMAPEFQRR